jgi:hypothetical protein
VRQRRAGEAASWLKHPPQRIGYLDLGPTDKHGRRRVTVGAFMADVGVASNVADTKPA